MSCWALKVPALGTGCTGAELVELCTLQAALWLTQKALAELFGVGVPAVNKQ